MSTATAFGSITIIDVTDIGEFSVYPMSNLPLSVIYDPNNANFVPDWSTSNLQLTPVLYYAGKALDLSATGLTITWQRQEGIGGVTAISSGETNDGGILKVTSNKFNVNSTMITYIVTATYLEPTSQVTLNAQGQITFTMTKQASAVKNCNITGESIFKYDTNRTLVSTNPLVLTGSTASVAIDRWQYKDADGNWKDYPITSGHNTSITSSTLKVYAEEESIFSNDRAVIRLLSSDANIYDIVTITKLRDGAPGESVVSMILTNDNQMVPTDSSGTPVSGALANAYTQVILYEGGEAADGWTVTATPSSVTGTWDPSSLTYTVTGISASVGYVDFKAEKSGYNPVTKRFTLTKVKSGADGVSPTVYTIESSSLVVNKSIDNVLTPNSLTFSAYSWVGTSKTAYAGIIKVYTDDNTTPVYTSQSTESSHVFSLTNYINVSKLRVELYDTAGTTKYDSQTVVYTADGATGQQGQQGATGESAINVILGNYADVIPVTSNYKTSAQTVINIPFSAYEGTNKIACSVTAPSLFGVTATQQSSTASADGYVKYTIPANTSAGSASASSGIISLTFNYTTAKGKTGSVVMNYTWTVSRASVDGVSAILFQLYTPNGYIYLNGSGSLSVNGALMEGATDKTSEASNWKWYKYDVGSSKYVQITSSNSDGITGYNTSSLTVPGSAVSGYISLKCEVTYENEVYTQYSSLLDKSDPLQAEIFSTIGTQLVNGQGIGALYCRVLRNGVEVDALKTYSITTVEPTEPSTGEYWYKLDSTEKSVTLMKFNGTAWEAAPDSDNPTGTYTWSYRDAEGEPVTQGVPATSGKVIYIDATLVNRKLIADVQVEI